MSEAGSEVSDASGFDAWKTEAGMDLEGISESPFSMIRKKVEEAAFGMLFTLVKDNSFYKKLVFITILVEYIRIQSYFLPFYVGGCDVCGNGSRHGMTQKAMNFLFGVLRFSLTLFLPQS
jgi:hypothetical protein